jgi:hypothetical protein
LIDAALYLAAYGESCVKLGAGTRDAMLALARQAADKSEKARTAVGRLKRDA